MSQHADILDERESLRSPFLGSLVVHAGMVALPLLLHLCGVPRLNSWGNPNSRGGAGRNHSGGANSHSVAAGADQSGCE